MILKQQYCHLLENRETVTKQLMANSAPATSKWCLVSIKWCLSKYITSQWDMKNASAYYESFRKYTYHRWLCSATSNNVIFCYPLDKRCLFRSILPLRAPNAEGTSSFILV